MLAYCRQRGIKLTVFGVVAGGLLSESFLGLAKKEAVAAINTVSRKMYMQSLQRWTRNWALFQRLLATLQSIGERKSPSLSVAAVACLWALRQLDDLGAGGALILGVRDAKHLEEHRQLLGTEASALSEEDMAEIKAILDEGNAPEGDVY